VNLKFFDLYEIYDCCYSNNVSFIKLKDGLKKHCLGFIHDDIGVYEIKNEENIIGVLNSFEKFNDIVDVTKFIYDLKELLDYGWGYIKVGDYLIDGNEIYEEIIKIVMSMEEKEIENEIFIDAWRSIEMLATERILKRITNNEKKELNKQIKNAFEYFSEMKKIYN
jgi:hypothetical protein